MYISTVVRMFHLSMQYLKSDADFVKASTVDRVKKHLNSMDNELKKKLKYARLLESSSCFKAVGGMLYIFMTTTNLGVK